MLNLLVVDDEKLIRKGLIKVLGRCGVDCRVMGEAANGLEALELIRKERPDVIITDVKMPRMDGVELIKNVEMNYPDIRMIVLSGFDEFNYVRDTMRRGAKDYLLKPVDVDQLAALLKKLENDIAKENERTAKELNLKARLNESLPLLKEQFIRELICEKKYSESNIGDKLESYNIGIFPEPYCVIIIDVDNYGMIYKNLGADDARLEAFIVKNISEESVGNLVSFFSCSINHELVIVASIPRGDKKKLKEVIDTTFYNLDRYSGVRFTLCVGTLVDSLARLNESYNEAHNLLKQRFYNETSSVITPETGNRKAKTARDEANANFFEQFENRLKSCVELANFGQVKEAVIEFCSNLTSSQCDPQDAVKFLSETYIKMQMGFPEFAKAVCELYGNEYSYVKELDFFDTLDEIRKYTIDLYGRVIRMIGDIRKRKDKKLVEIVKDYVFRHYSEDITLNRISEIVYMNPSYICDLFKNQTGEHFVEFLTRVRIEKAKTLLRDVKIKAYEVGQMVGYEDPTYFSKVFKKVVGVSPSQYKSLVE